MSSWPNRPTPKALEEVKRLLPSVLADARQVALDSTSMGAMLRSLAAELDSDPEGRFPGSDRKDVAALLRWLADGHFVLLGYQRCQVRDGSGLCRSIPVVSVCCDCATDVLPQLTEKRRPAGAGAGHHPQLPALRCLPVHRGGPRNGQAGTAIEHRFVGLFHGGRHETPMWLEIPLISRRVNDALAMGATAIPAIPASLLLDIIQTIPRSELFALSAKAAAGHGDGKWSTSVRGAGRCCSCAPINSLTSCRAWCISRPDRYTTAVRLEMQDILGPASWAA